MKTPRLHGRIASIRYDHNYGFVIPNDPERKGEEIFFHSTAVASDLRDFKPGDAVTFEEMYTKKGLRAVHVQREETK